MVLSVRPIELPSLIFYVYSYKTFDGFTNMALDHYFASNSEQNFNPIIRFYGWQPCCLSMGYHQQVETIRTDRLREDRFDLIRRPTGGRAILHAEELTYSIIFPKNFVSQKDLYNYVHLIFKNVLNQLGFAVELATNKPKLKKVAATATDFPCFTSSAETEVEYQGKKLIGSAQKIYPNSILQHGSILIGQKHQLITKYLKSEQNERINIENEIRNKTICLNEIKESDITPHLLEKAILKQLESGGNNSLIFKELVSSTIESARKKYKNDFDQLYKK